MTTATDTKTDTDVTSGELTDAVAKAVAVEDTALPSWDDLLSTAELVSVNTRPKKVRVDVPPQLVALLEKARDTNQRVLFPITRGNEQITELANVLGSAGDLMKPDRASVLVTTVDENGKKTADVEKITHVRVNIGKRRGGGAAKRAPKVPAIKGPENGNPAPESTPADASPASAPPA